MRTCGDDCEHERDPRMNCQRSIRSGPASARGSRNFLCQLPPRRGPANLLLLLLWQPGAGATGKFRSCSTHLCMDRLRLEELESKKAQGTAWPARPADRGAARFLRGDYSMQTARLEGRKEIFATAGREHDNDLGSSTVLQPRLPVNHGNSSHDVFRRLIRLPLAVHAANTCRGSSLSRLDFLLGERRRTS